MVEDEMVTITKDEYDELVNNTKLLDALEAAGVEYTGVYEIALQIVAAFK